MLILDHYPDLETLNFSFQVKKQDQDRGVSYESLRTQYIRKASASGFPEYGGVQQDGSIP